MQERGRWEARHRAAGDRPRPPSTFLRSLDALLPSGEAGRPAPRALDVAGGPGDDALWLAARGLDVTLADFSRPALASAAAKARAAGVPLRCLETDLERAPFPPGPWDVIVCSNFLWRPLFAVFPGALAPGGLLVFRQPTRRNLERHARPSVHHLLEEGELPRLVAPLEILRCEEGWFEDRHEARLVARRGW
jgi:tellurite methyltransferase